MLNNICIFGGIILYIEFVNIVVIFIMLFIECIINLRVFLNTWVNYPIENIKT